MNASELINELKVYKSKETLHHATRLLAIYSLIKTLNIDCVTVTENHVINFGKKSEYKKINWYPAEYGLEVVYSGYELPANEITVTTNKGEYKFLVPINNSFYSDLCLLLKIGQMEPEKIDIKESIYIESSVIEKVKKAAKFVAKKDDLCNDSMKTVLLNIENGFVEVVASDCHQLYVSEKMECSGENRQILVKNFSEMAKIKTKDSLLQIDLLPENLALINGVKIQLDTEHVFPKFRSVMPEKTLKMTFNRADFVDCNKTVLIAANKYSHLVKLHLNGSIEMTGHDIDFGVESVKSIPYEVKEFEDMDIGFNGIRLNDCLNVFKSTDIDMYCTNANRAVQFTDGKDIALLMPMMLNY